MSVLLTHLFQQFKMSLAGSHTAKQWLRDQGINTHLGEVGYVSRRFHHQKSEAFIQECLQVGILIPAHMGGLAPKVKEALLFPLKNRQGLIVNFWLYAPQSGKQDFLNAEGGFFPAFPDDNTESLYCTADIIEALKQRSVQPKQTEQILALTDEVEPETLASLPCLKAIYLPKDREDFFEYFKTNRPDVAVFSCEGYRVEAEESKESENTTSTEEPNEEQTITVIHPHKCRMPACFGGYFEILGALPRDLGCMKVTLHYVTDGGRKYRSKPDLYEREHIDRFVRGLSTQEHVPEQLIEHDLLRLTSLLEKMREAEYLESAPEQLPKEEFTPERKSSATELLRDPSVLERIQELLGKSGIVGEEDSRLALFLVASSYKFPIPLHAIVTATSGSGKSALINGIASCLPPEDCISLTRMSSKSFFHFGEDELVGKLLVVQDLNGLPSEALYALRELQSYQTIRSSVTRKDKYGNMSTTVKTVRGRFSSLSATTRNVLFDNDSRSLNFQIDESVEQTERISDYQALVASGQVSRHQEEEARRTLSDLVRMLEPKETVNPFAGRVRLPMHIKGHRRLAPMFALFVSLVANWNRYQRTEDESGRIIVEVEDIRQAVRIFFSAIFLRSDDLNGSIRQFFERLKGFVKQKPQGIKSTFTQRELRLAFGLSKAHVSRYLAELRSMEYVTISGGFKNRMYLYNIAYEDDYRKMREEILLHLEEQIQALETPL